MTTTIFANVLNLRTTPTELVLEFGSYFPDRPGVSPPSDYKPDVRVVVNISLLQALMGGLQQASQQRAGAAAAAAKAPPGFPTSPVTGGGQGT